MTIGLLEGKQTIGQTLVTNLTKLFDQYGLRKKLLHMSKMKVKFNYIHDNCFETNYQISSLGLD
jgi:hypothetical protein